MGYEAELAYADLAAKLNALNQSHVFRFWAFLTPEQQADFARQLNSLDWDLIHTLATTIVKQPQKFQLPTNVQPAPYYPQHPTDPATQKKFQQAFHRGEELIRHGQVAAFCVAGGQGTRLGWDAPKGTFPASPIRKKPLFQLFAEYLQAIAARLNAPPIPFYIMTSPQNDSATRHFWQQHHHFGLNPQDLMFFPQDQMPAFAPDGKVLLESKSSLALSPNGHGGSLLALQKSGALADMKRRNITQISYFQVDNPLVRCIDPLFLGLHDLDHAQMSSKMLPKAAPKEKLGNFALVVNKMSIIEYSDLPDELAEQKLPDGTLRFRAGSIAVHALRRDFVEQLTEGRCAMPFHRAEKKVPCIDLETGAPINPNQPNAIKLETFVFDALPLTQKSIIYETDRIEEFAPIKNPAGVDSAESSIHITTQRNARWLEAANIPIPKNPDGSPNCIIEISPTFALSSTDIPPKKSQIPPINPGDKIYLE